MDKWYGTKQEGRYHSTDPENRDDPRIEWLVPSQGFSPFVSFNPEPSQLCCACASTGAMVVILRACGPVKI